jgi:tRNA modification GTPase
MAGDTIVALSSGAVPSGVAVIRLSGPQSGPVLQEILGTLPVARKLVLAPITLSGETLDTGLVTWMPGPASFTGEDCVELHVHGSRAVVRSLLRKLSARTGVRLAEAGEFTRRAFENGKLDLVEAQGLGDLIDAETENQRAMAYARMEGGLTRRIDGWRERLLDLRAFIEAQLDFSDEGDVGDLPPHFVTDVVTLASELAAAIDGGNQGRIIRQGFRVVLAGPPNAGKSSLLNALSQSDVAIVSDEAGTTRDLKEVPLDLNGQLVVLIDSAGLRETDSKAEAIGVNRARQAMASADLVLWLQAADQPSSAAPHIQQPILRLGTKADLGEIEGMEMSVSASTGEGVQELLTYLAETSGVSNVRAGDVLVSHEQDRIALAAAHRAISDVHTLLNQPELAAEKLRMASAALERLLGKIDAEKVLDHLFARFCIGK